MKQKDLEFATGEQILMHLMQDKGTQIRFYSPDIDPNDDKEWDYWQISWCGSSIWIDGEWHPTEGFYVEHRKGYAEWSGYTPSLGWSYDDDEYYDDDDDGQDPDWSEYSTAQIEPEEVLTKINELIEDNFRPAFELYWDLPS